jgi:uncharacterized protein (DUF1330 family)
MIMSVFVVVQGTAAPNRLDTLKQYQSAARPIIARHGGQPVMRGSAIESLSGTHKFQIGIVIRFPDLAAVRAWHNDPDYQKVIPLRSQAYQDLEINVFQEE